MKSTRNNVAVTSVVHPHAYGLCGSRHPTRAAYKYPTSILYLTTPAFGEVLRPDMRLAPGFEEDFEPCRCQYRR